MGILLHFPIRDARTEEEKYDAAVVKQQMPDVNEIFRGELKRILIDIGDRHG